MSKRLVSVSSGVGAVLWPTRCHELHAVSRRRRLRRGRNTRPPSGTGGNRGGEVGRRLSPAAKQGQARPGRLLAGAARGEYLPPTHDARRSHRAHGRRPPPHQARRRGRHRAGLQGRASRARPDRHQGAPPAARAGPDRGQALPARGRVRRARGAPERGPHLGVRRGGRRATSSRSSGRRARRSSSSPRARGRWRPRWWRTSSSRWARRSPPRTPPASSTATSSPPTSCTTRPRRRPSCWTSGSRATPRLPRRSG